MYPVLFRIGEIPIPTYGLVLVAAFLSAIFSCAYLATRIGAPFSQTVDFAFSLAISGEVGARLTFVIVEWEQFATGSITFKHFLLSGRVVLGGVATALVVGYLVARRMFARYSATDIATLADTGFTGTILGMGIGRLGCLLGGCCYGKPTELAWGITFTDPLARYYSGTPLGEPLHPTQPLQALDSFMLFGIMFWAFHRGRFAGLAAGLFWVVGGATRFLVEFLRGDPRGGLLGLSTSQWIGLAGVILGSLWLRFASRRFVVAGSGAR